MIITDYMRTKKNKKKVLQRYLLATLAALSASQTQAVELKIFGTNQPPIDFHGFAGQGFIVNSGNNQYLGGDSKDGTIDFREYGINASWAKGKWRVGAQVFGQKLGPYGDDKIKLDWANVDYQAAQWFGVRVGRVKMPRGLYNEALDLDSTRPFTLLPQSIYDARLRDFNAAFNGGMIYGNVDLGKVGSVDYRVFGGMMPVSMKSGAVDYFNTAYFAPALDMSIDHVVGGTVFWNTPLNGLKFGYSCSVLDDLSVTKVTSFGGAAPVPYTRYSDPIFRHMLSAEYNWGKWTFAAEGGMDNTLYHYSFSNTTTTDYQGYNYYVSAARRINRWLELGTYFSHSQDITQGFSTLTQGDLALSGKIDFNEYIYLKLEGHYMDGAGKIFTDSTYSQPLANRTDQWFLFTTKVGISF